MEDRYLITNYRPISLLSTFDKLLEKLMYKRLYTFITDNNILYEYQFGSRKNYSTTIAFADVIDNIYCSLDNDDTVVGIFLDLEKAFDTVKPDIYCYTKCIRGLAYKWFVSNLSNRKQYTFMTDVI